MISGFLQQLLNGLTIGMVYVLLAAGLSIIFGVMHVINFAHGELFALGAYFAVAIAMPIGGGAGFVTALLVAPLLVGAIGYGIERATVRPLYGRNPLYHILLTFGLVLIINDLIVLAWGRSSLYFPIPDLLNGSVTVFGFSYSLYNYFMIVFAALLAAGVWALLTYTRFGLIVRAGAQDREMVRLLGIDIDRYYSLVFGFGAALAGVAGIILGGYQVVAPSMGMSIIIPAFVIVVLGGLGSFKGAVVGGLLVGLVQTLMRSYVPVLEGLVVFLLMIGVLLVRPRGIFGVEQAEDDGGRLLEASRGAFLDPQTRFRLGAAGVVALALVPLGSGWLYSTYVVTLLIEILIWGLFALSLDFVMGYTGLVSLGHALFYGLGAYAAVLVLLHVTPSAFVALGLAVLISALVAWVVGFLSIRVAGVYFAMITLGFAELFYNLLYKFEFTGGSDGLFGAQSFFGVVGVGVDLSAIVVGVGPVALTGSRLFYYFLLACVVGSYLLTRRMMRAPFGSVLQSIRENEQRARFIGYDVTVYKRRAFVVSGALAGLAGGLFVLHGGYVAPSFAYWLRSGEVVVMVVLGGMGTLYGPLLGAGIFLGLETVLVSYTSFWRLVLGIIFVAFVIFVPGGFVSLPRTIAARRRRETTRDIRPDRSPEPEESD
ncbi:ABC transporter permease [Haloferacaceae archaeon DSL9]